MKGMSETVSTASNAADAWTNPLLGIVAAHHRAIGERHGAGNLQ